MVDYQVFHMVVPNSLVVRGGHTAGTRSGKADNDLGVSLTLHFCLGPEERPVWDMGLSFSPKAHRTSAQLLCLQVSV